MYDRNIDAILKSSESSCYDYLYEINVLHEYHLSDFIETSTISAKSMIVMMQLTFELKLGMLRNIVKVHH
jgi:hypothetical protein